MKVHLVFAAMAAVLFAFAISRAPVEAFTFEKVRAEAARIAAKPYKAARSPVPKFLREIGYDQYRDLRFREDRTLWRNIGRPFQARFFHPGYLYNRIVEFYEIDGPRVEPIRYSPDLFVFEKSMAPVQRQVPENLGFAGFRVHHPLNRSDVLDEVISFLGESYFRALGKNQVWGLSARGLAVNPFTKAPEEFPAFTKFWLERPGSYAQALHFYALLEGPSVTGAYEFWLEPGEDTRLRVKAALFLRKKVERLGLAPLTSMFWFGENTSNTFGDFRPEVHDSDGLLVLNGSGEWLWRPLSHGTALQQNVFADARGFGLLQRDRDFAHYQDLEAKYHQRPSVWVELGRGWDRGAAHLVQLPAKNEYNDNVVAFWAPETAPKAGSTIELEYTLHWFTENAAWPPGGRCMATRIDYQEAPFFRQFFLDFASGELRDLKPEAGITADIFASEGVPLKDVIVQKNEFDKSWRVNFIVSTKKLGKPIELRCALKQGDRALTETWSYTWTP
jgi:glucans biosynthesis protein